MLPKALRDAINRAWRDRQAGRPGAAGAHEGAKAAAARWYERRAP